MKAKRKHTHRKSGARWSVCVALISCGVTTSIQADEKFEFDIERQPIGDALPELFVQTSRQIAYSSLPTPGHEQEEQATLVGPLKGLYTMNEALEALFAPVGWSYQMISPTQIDVYQPTWPQLCK